LPHQEDSIYCYELVQPVQSCVRTRDHILAIVYMASAAYSAVGSLPAFPLAFDFYQTDCRAVTFSNLSDCSGESSGGPAAIEYFARGCRGLPPKMPKTCWCRRRRRAPPGLNGFGPYSHCELQSAQDFNWDASRCQFGPGRSRNRVRLSDCLSELWRPGSSLDRRQAWLCPSCGAFGQRATRRQQLRPPLPPVLLIRLADCRHHRAAKKVLLLLLLTATILLAVAWRYRCFQQQYVVYVRSRHGDAGACRWHRLEDGRVDCLSADSRVFDEAAFAVPCVLVYAGAGPGCYGVLTALLTLSGRLLLLYFYRRYSSTGRPLAQQGAPASGRPQLAGRSRLRNPSLTQQPSRSAFRKRDRLSYWLRRMMRQAAPNLPKMPRLPQGAELMQLLRPGQRYQQQQLRQRQPLMDGIPDYFLEPTDADDDFAWPPPMLNEFYLAVRSLRIFDGCGKCLEIVQLRHGETLFDLGDADGDLYIVQRGRVRLLLLEQQQQQQFHEFRRASLNLFSAQLLRSFSLVLRLSSNLLRAVVASSSAALLPNSRRPDWPSCWPSRSTGSPWYGWCSLLSSGCSGALNSYLGLTSELVSSDSQAPSGCRVLSLASSAAAATGVPPGSSTPAPQPVPMASKPPPVLTPTPSAAIPIRVFRRLPVEVAVCRAATAASADFRRLRLGPGRSRRSTDFDAPRARPPCGGRRNDDAGRRSHHRRTASASSTNLDRNEGRPSDSEDSDSANWTERKGRGAGASSRATASLLARSLHWLSVRALLASAFVAAAESGITSTRLRHQHSSSSERERSDGTPVTFQRLRKAAQKTRRRPVRSSCCPLLRPGPGASCFGLSDASLLDGRGSACANVHARPQAGQAGRAFATLFYSVVTGKLWLRYQGSSLLYSAGPGELCGMIAILTGEASLFTVRCEADACVAAISSRDFYALMRAQPSLSGAAAGQFNCGLCAGLALSGVWQEPLYKQGDIANAVYLLLHGRLRQAHTTPQGHKELTAELGRGDLVGFLEVFTARPRATTVLASRTGREFELYRLPMSNLRSVALFPASAKVPLESILPGAAARHVNHRGQSAPQLPHHAQTIRSQSIRSRPGVTGSPAGWLSKEDDHRLLLYLCDLDKTAWTKRCIRQADCVLIVALASDRVETMDHVRQVVLPRFLPRKTGEFLSRRASEPLGDNRLVIQQHLHVARPASNV
uniref:Cyclic nucleotide-binding domain-containing protein n=1 Tax=Macrostomum lignano TaxID=282301 RepID=A0A1I8FDS5_9PLAT